jgi:hypothetical protein
MTNPTSLAGAPLAALAKEWLASTHEVGPITRGAIFQFARWLTARGVTVDAPAEPSEAAVEAAMEALNRVAPFNARDPSRGSYRNDIRVAVHAAYKVDGTAP